MIAKNAKVRQVAPAAQGEVVARRFNEDASAMEYLVDFKVGEEDHQRWFLESEIEEVKEAA